MQLPILETPKFNTTLPSTGENIEYRPFLVKEQKILLMAQQTEDEKEIVNAMRDIIDVCTFDKLKNKDLPVFDIQYLFLQIRAKSVEEKIHLEYKHNKCGHTQRVEIDLTKLEIYKDENHTNKIQLNDDVGVIMRYPTAQELADPGVSDNDVDAYLKIITKTIEKIYTKDEVYPNSPEMYDSMQKFIESLTQEQFNKIVNFFTTMPEIRYNLKYKCENCGEEIHHVLEGIRDFF